MCVYWCTEVIFADFSLYSKLNVIGAVTMSCPSLKFFESKSTCLMKSRLTNDYCGPNYEESQNYLSNAVDRISAFHDVCCRCLINLIKVKIDAKN